jgi:hypothetical protein
MTRTEVNEGGLTPPEGPVRPDNHRTDSFHQRPPAGLPLPRGSADRPVCHGLFRGRRAKVLAVAGCLGNGGGLYASVTANATYEESAPAGQAIPSACW